MGAGSALRSDSSLGSCGSTPCIHLERSSERRRLNWGQKNHMSENARSIFLQSSSVARRQPPPPHGDSGSQAPTACCHLPPRTGRASPPGLRATAAHLPAPKQPGASRGALPEERPVRGQLCRALRAGHGAGRACLGSPAARGGLGGTSKLPPEDPELVLLQQSFPASRRQWEEMK